MKKLLLPLVAVLAVAAPAAAFAGNGAGHHARTSARTPFVVRVVVLEHHVRPVATFVRLTGSGTSFAANAATVNGTVVGVAAPAGSFSASISTNWSAATTKTVKRIVNGVTKNISVSCVAATASVTLPATSASAATTATFVGHACAINRTGTPVYHFSGASTDGLHIFLRQKNTAVRGLLGHSFVTPQVLPGTPAPTTAGGSPKTTPPTTAGGSPKTTPPTTAGK
jgi:hypothetical protein